MVKELTVCKECAPEETLREFPNLTGYFDIERRGDGYVAICNNCRAERPYSPKTPRPENGTTKSQQRAIDKIRRFGEGRSDDVEIETEHLEWGPMSLTMTIDDDSFFLRGRYHCIISRRGKITVCSAGGFTYPDDHIDHFANMVGGHIQE